MQNIRYQVKERGTIDLKVNEDTGQSSHCSVQRGQSEVDNCPGKTLAICFDHTKSGRLFSQLFGMNSFTIQWPLSINYLSAGKGVYEGWCDIQWPN